MISIGVTGGIGSGKSVVTRIMQAMGYPVYLTDNEARRLMNSDEGIRSRLIDLLGDQVYSGGVLNKALLADYLFAAPEHTARINAIVHPVVRADFREWLRLQQADLAFMESAILFESGFQNETDAVVMVSAPEETRIERAMKRDAVSREAIMRRIATQMSDMDKCQLADFVIYNGKDDLLLPQLLRLISLLSENNHYLCRPK